MTREQRHLLVTLLAAQDTVAEARRAAEAASAVARMTNVLARCEAAVREIRQEVAANVLVPPTAA